MIRTIMTLASMGLVLSGCSASTEAKKPTGQLAVTHSVLYEAEGSGVRGPRTATYTAQTPSGTAQGAIDLPLRNRDGGTGLTLAGFQTGAFVYLSIQNGDPAGSVTCRITVDGVVISENTSVGGYTIATCKGRVP